MKTVVRETTVTVNGKNKYHPVYAGRGKTPKWLIIQLARFGDLMQTVPIVAASRALNPQPEIHLLVTHDLFDLAGTIEGVHRVWGSERHKWLAAMHNPSASLIDWAELVKELVEPLSREKFDRVINITHTPESAYISSLIDGGDVSGLYGVRDRILAVGQWENYFQEILSNRTKNTINLVDIHLRIAGIPPTGSNGRLNINNDLGRRFRELIDSEVEPGQPVFALQLGTNSQLRRWRVDKFAAVVDLTVRKTGALAVLLGSSAEAELAEAFQSFSESRVLNLIGRTSLVELAAVLQSCRLLFGSDTGTIHLAAALGIPAVSVFLAMARPEDTAPYGEGHVVFKPLRSCYPCPERCVCSHVSCHEDIPPEAVAGVIISRLNSTTGQLPAGNGFETYHTAFNEEGFQILTKNDSATGLQNNTGTEHVRLIAAGNISAERRAN